MSIKNQWNFTDGKRNSTEMTYPNKMDKKDTNSNYMMKDKHSYMQIAEEISRNQYY